MADEERVAIEIPEGDFGRTVAWGDSDKSDDEVLVVAKGESIKGVYKGEDEVKTKFITDSNPGGIKIKYLLELEDGEEVEIFETARLRHIFKQIDVGTKVELLYKGMAPMTNGKGHDIEGFTLRPATATGRSRTRGSRA